MARPEDASGSGKKRKLGRAVQGKPLKRRKNNAGAKSSQPAAKPRRVVAVDELKWKPVAVPEMFDDAEGFFGLEEVEGVDIVREGESVQFVTADPADTYDDVFEGFDDLPKAAIEPAAAAPEEDKAAAEAGAVNGQKAAKQAKAPQTKERKGQSEKSEEKETKGLKKTDKKKEAKQAKDDKGGAKGGDKDKGGKKASAAVASADDELRKGGGFSMLANLGSDAEDDDGTDVSAWVPLHLSPPLVSCLAKLKFAKPTAIQAAAIPKILAGHDVIGKASTGSGKTLAFAIPIVEQWLAASGRAVDAAKTDKDGKKTPTALILSPTRELAHQIANHIKALCGALPSAPYVCAITGGLSVFKQQRQLEKADIVVGTPGRLWDVLSASKPLLAAFRSVPFLVVDEADRLLSDGHFKEAEEILLALDRQETHEQEGAEGDASYEAAGAAQIPRQTLVFSATFNKGLQQKLAGKDKSRYDLMDQAQSMEHLLKRLNFREEHPKFIDVNPVSQMAARLKEGMVECGAMEKDLYLYALLLLQPKRRTLVFTNSISSVRRLTPMLQNLNLPTLALHSEMPEKARLRSVERFTAAQASRGSVLITTDVAARGLDIPGTDAVIHYHVPRTADNYVHRSGRTARGERGGTSILICGPEEVVPTRRLVAKIHAAALPKSEDDAERPGGKNKGTAFFIRTVNIDRRLVSRLRDRLVLAKTLADATLAKEKGNKDDQWLRNAAEELGVDYDSEEFEKAGSWSGRGSGRRRKEKEARELTKAQAGALRAQLKQLLATRINTGVSERYFTGGAWDVDVNGLLRGEAGDFFGKVDGLGLDD